ncbi:MAG: Alanine racemase [Parcubacteria group bacterium GW2011_GWA1_47_8]|nr:MAG: Alanine racemase [Parcubacteria group bacterium GW2011_GWA1_47_8]KKW07535.1 MAG: Alanine racemase [Parcubacteria group bacterium GW2011_GWA2_49_16]
MSREVVSLVELRAVAEAFLRKLATTPRTESATVVALSGDLGAGKTAFTKEVAALLDITETITSPTFVLEKKYPIPSGKNAIGFRTLVHIDAYRLNSSKEMRALAWDEVLADPANLVLIEWPEQVAEVIPAQAHRISFEYVDEGVRRISGEDI